MTTLPDYLTITGQPQDVLDQLISKWGVDKIAVLVDENTKSVCLPRISPQKMVEIEIRSGEEYKNIQTCEHIWKMLTEHRFSRKSLLVNLGGGVIGDMGGFAASTYKRGIRFVNVPTTLLSQVDASIGGKLGIDFMGLKNHIGLFRTPDHVIVDPAFLETLPEREKISGFAEVLKHALIADHTHWEYLKATPWEKLDWEKLIPHSIKLKNDVVLQDPTEQGYRKILNFGHTLGHAVETHSLNTDAKLMHGEAVALGIITESHLSFQMGLLNQEELDEIVEVVLRVFRLPKELPDLAKLSELLMQDKKNEGSIVNFSLLKAIGSCIYDQQVTDQMLNASIEYYHLVR